MHPILFSIGDFPIHTFGVLVLIGVVVTLFWTGRDAPRVGIKGDDLINMGVEVFIAGLIGSRIFFIWLNWDEMYSKIPWYQMFNLRTGGLVFYGGLLTATPVGFWRAKAYGVPVRAACDVMAGAVLIGLTVGRMGCLSAGDDHGKVNYVDPAFGSANMAGGDIVLVEEIAPWEDPQEVKRLLDRDHSPPVRYAERTWWTLTFTDEKALVSDKFFLNKPLLPAQPIMSLGAFCCFLILFSLRKRLAHAPSALTALLFTVYPTHRFLVEFIRGDPVRKYVPDDVFLFGGLSTSQAISAPIVPVALFAFIYLVVRYKGASPPTPLVEEEEGGDGQAEGAKQAEEPKAVKDAKAAEEPKAIVPEGSESTPATEGQES